MLNTLISKVIRQVVREFDKHPFDINCGECDEFASRVEYLLPGANGVAVNLDEDLPGHVYIEYRGKFYDAEELGGVEDYRKLPIFARYLSTKTR